MTVRTTSFQDSDASPTLVRVCCGTTCRQRFSRDVLTQAENYAAMSGNKYHVEKCSCRGHCEHGPNVEVAGKLYHEVHEGKIEDIMKREKI